MNLNEAIIAVKAGQKDAYVIVIRETVLTTRAFLAARLFDQSLLDDLTQEIYIAAFEKIKNYQEELCFQSWLLGIARNKLKMHFRQTKTKNKAYEKWFDLWQKNTESSSTDENTQASNLSEKLKKCLAKINERMSLVLQMKYQENKKSEEIAQFLQLKEDAVNALLYRCRKKLAKCLESQSSE